MFNDLAELKALSDQKIPKFLVSAVTMEQLLTLAESNPEIQNLIKYLYVKEYDEGNQKTC